MFDNIYNYRLKDAKKLALKINPELENNSYKFYDIVFYDTNSLNNQLEVFACTAKDQFDNIYILVNQKYQKDDIEPLSCLISHEFVHILKTPTLEEEIFATTKEVQTWEKIKKENYKKTELTDRLDSLLVLYKENKLEDYIKQEYKNIY